MIAVNMIEQKQQRAVKKWIAAKKMEQQKWIAAKMANAPKKGMMAKTAAKMRKIINNNRSNLVI